MLTPEDFVKAYMKAYKDGVSQTELCKRLGLDRALVSYRKQSYIKRGVNLPPLVRASTASIRSRGIGSIDKLNELIEKDKSGAGVSK